MLDATAVKNWLLSFLGDSVVAWIVVLYWNGVAPVFAEPRLIPPFIATTVLTAVAYYYWQRRLGRAQGNLISFLFPKRVYLHHSAKLDYKFFVVNQLLMAHLAFGKLVVFVVGLLSISTLTTAALSLVFGERQAIDTSPGPLVLAVYTFVNLLAWDFGKWYAHYLTHKVPVLWEFHKVHHAEEVLTPISAFRAHPFDVMIDFFFRLVCTGVVGGSFAYFYPYGVTELTILGFNAIGVFIHYWISHLQHSHIPVNYGRFNRLLFSPVMHQVHHSCEVQHWDKNFGFIFGFWDHMFGTIHIPREGEKVTLGLPEGKGAGEYNTLTELYFRPFLGTWRILTARARTTAPTSNPR